MRRVIPIAGALIASLAASGARADDFSDFNAARQAYLEQRWHDAVQLFQEMVGGEIPRLQNETLILESRKYLGSAYLFVENREGAEEQFALLLRQDPQYELDPLQFPRDVREVFDSVRDDVQADLDREAREARDRALRRALAAQEREAAMLMRLDRLEELARVETVEVRNSRALALVPFGVGQFRNGHRGFGIFLAATQSFFLVATVASFAVHLNALRESQRSGEPGFDEPRWRQAEQASRITNQLSFSILGALVGVGLIDAQVRYVPVRQERRERELPEDVPELPDLDAAPEVSFGLGLGTASLRLTF